MLMTWQLLQWTYRGTLPVLCSIIKITEHLRYSIYVFHSYHCLSSSSASTFSQILEYNRLCLKLYVYTSNTDNNNCARLIHVALPDDTEHTSNTVCQHIRYGGCNKAITEQANWNRKPSSLQQVPLIFFLEELFSCRCIKHSIRVANGGKYVLQLQLFLSIIST